MQLINRGRAKFCRCIATADAHAGIDVLARGRGARLRHAAGAGAAGGAHSGAASPACGASPARGARASGSPAGSPSSAGGGGAGGGHGRGTSRLGAARGRGGRGRGRGGGAGLHLEGAAFVGTVTCGRQVCKCASRQAGLPQSPACMAAPAACAAAWPRFQKQASPLTPPAQHPAPTPPPQASTHLDLGGGEGVHDGRGAGPDDGHEAGRHGGRLGRGQGGRKALGKVGARGGEGGGGCGAGGGGERVLGLSDGTVSVSLQTSFPMRLGSSMVHGASTRVGSQCVSTQPSQCTNQPGGAHRPRRARLPRSS